LIVHCAGVPQAKKHKNTNKASALGLASIQSFSAIFVATAMLTVKIIRIAQPLPECLKASKVNLFKLPEIRRLTWQTSILNGTPPHPLHCQSGYA
jgi:hypothetical protein